MRDFLCSPSFLRIPPEADSDSSAVLAIRRYGKRHTLPYLLSLALEYLAYSLRQSSTSKLSHDKASGPMLPRQTPSELERQESSKRARAFWWYLLRGPVWESWTKCVALLISQSELYLQLNVHRPRLESMARTFEDKPLVGFVSTMLQDYIPLYDEYYYCASRPRVAVCCTSLTLTRSEDSA